MTCSSPYTSEKKSVDSGPNGLDFDSLETDVLELDPEVPDSWVFSEFVGETVSCSS